MANDCLLHEQTIKKCEDCQELIWTVKSKSALTSPQKRGLDEFSPQECLCTLPDTISVASHENCKPNDKIVPNKSKIRKLESPQINTTIPDTNSVASHEDDKYTDNIVRDEFRTQLLATDCILTLLDTVQDNFVQYNISKYYDGEDIRCLIEQRLNWYLFEVEIQTVKTPRLLKEKETIMSLLDGLRNVRRTLVLRATKAFRKGKRVKYETVKTEVPAAPSMFDEMLGDKISIVSYKIKKIKNEIVFPPKHCQLYKLLLFVLMEYDEPRIERLRVVSIIIIGYKYCVVQLANINSKKTLYFVTEYTTEIEEQLDEFESIPGYMNRSEIMVDNIFNDEDFDEMPEVQGFSNVINNGQRKDDLTITSENDTVIFHQKHLSALN